MKIAIVAAEIAPWAKAGGLADVLGALPAALASCGAEPSVVVPGYKALLENLETETLISELRVPLGDGTEAFALKRAAGQNGVALYLIDHPDYFGRPGVYGERGVDYPDNLSRYVTFGRAAALVAARVLKPDVLHVHDWHGSVASIVARADPSLAKDLSGTVSVFTVHNFAFQGIFDASEFALLDIDPSYFSVDYLEFHGRMNLMKGALKLADGASTVSPSYAREVSSDPEMGFGLEGVLRHMGNRFVGILNGADYGEWNPATDTLIAARYTPGRPAGKKRCAEALRRRLELPVLDSVPLVGMVTRMTMQKGLDLLRDALEGVMALGVQLVMLSSGDSDLERFFGAAQERYPGQLRVVLEFDNALAHQIQAGCDMFLMPSRFEPCGLTQMYALKYGTAPVVRATGGLRDTVAEFSPDSKNGTGFVFEDYRPQALVGALSRAVAVFKNPALWRTLMKNCFAADFSWQKAARQYLDWFARLSSERSR